jgi:hypothetical protein
MLLSVLEMLWQAICQRCKGVAHAAPGKLQWVRAQTPSHVQPQSRVRTVNTPPVQERQGKLDERVLVPRP